MLFDKTFDFQKRWKEVPFVLRVVRSVTVSPSMPQNKVGRSSSKCRLYYHAIQETVQTLFSRMEDHSVHFLSGFLTLSVASMKSSNRRDDASCPTRITRRSTAAHLCCINRICQRFALVERLEERIETLERFNTSFSRFDIAKKAYIIVTTPR